MNEWPAGWYPDPEQAQTQRYWDGATWTEQRAPMVPQRPARVAYPENDGLAAFGWVMALLLPFVGAIVGVVLMSRQDRRGGSILIFAAVMMVVGFVFISAISSSSDF